MNTSKKTTTKLEKKATKKAGKKTAKKVAKKKAPKKKPYGARAPKGKATKHLLVVVSPTGDVSIHEPDSGQTEDDAIGDALYDSDEIVGAEVHHVILQFKLPAKPVAKKAKAKKSTKVHTVTPKPEETTTAPSDDDDSGNPLRG